jgi:hypothetical protein
LGPETKEWLINVIVIAWKSIQMFLMKKIIDSMPEQLEEMIRNERGHYHTE